MNYADIQIITTAEEANALVSDDLIDAALGWFEDERGIPSEEFIDRLCDSADGWDLDNYDNAAARRILERARKIKKDSQ
jgi:hypothetical protein